MIQPHLSIIIPTKDRRTDLLTCLRSIAAQTVQPHEIVIVDASTARCGDEPQCYQAASGAVPVRYVRAQQTGASRQRNQALRQLTPDTEYVMFLDDDVVLEPEYCQHMIAQLEHDPGLAGVAGNITNSQGYPAGKLSYWLMRLFLIDGPAPGRMLPSGFNTPLPVNLSGEPFAVEWLYGGNSCYRRAQIDGLRFDPAYERFAGYAYCEDLDFSYAVGKRGRLRYVPAARMVHNSSPAARLNDYRFGISQVANRGLFVAKHLPGAWHFACYLWAMLGTMLINGLMISRGRSYTRLLGNFIGLALVLSGQVRAAPAQRRQPQ